MSKPSFVLLTVLCWINGSGPLARAESLIQGQPIAAAGAVQSSQSVAAFRAADIAGAVHSDQDLVGRGGILYFFCGCDPCHRVARLWAQIQRGGALPRDAAGRTVSTEVFYFGEADAARSFIQETGLDTAQTAVIPDPMMTVGHRFGVAACPRVFAVDGTGQIAYTNTGKDDGPNAGSETALVSRAVQALRDAPRQTHRAQSAQTGDARFAPITGLVALPERGDEVISPVHVIRHLGEFDREKSRPIEQLLAIVNRGRGPVEIGKVEGSCGCTEIRLYPGDRRRPVSGLHQRRDRFPESDAKQSLTLEPGAVATLRVLLNVTEVEAGRHRKNAWVVLPGSEAAAITLSLDFAVHSSVMSDSKRVEFGLVKAGEARTVPFTITLDESRYAPSRPPAVVSTNPSVRVRPAGGALTTFREGKPVVQISYDVMLSRTAPLGNIAGQLVLHTGSESTQGVDRRPGRMAAKPSRTAPNVLASCGGEVVGEIRALPGTVLFGAVRGGKGARQRVTVLLERSEVRNGLHASTSAAWLEAHLVDPPASPAGKSLLGAYVNLDVILTPQAPPGTAEAAVTLTTASGQRLQIPVLATVPGKK